MKKTKNQNNQVLKLQRRPRIDKTYKEYIMTKEDKLDFDVKQSIEKLQNYITDFEQNNYLNGNQKDEIDLLIIDTISGTIKMLKTYQELKDKGASKDVLDDEYFKTAVQFVKIMIDNHLGD